MIVESKTDQTYSVQLLSLVHLLSKIQKIVIGIFIGGVTVYSAVIGAIIKKHFNPLKKRFRLFFNYVNI